MTAHRKITFHQLFEVIIFSAVLQINVSKFKKFVVHLLSKIADHVTLTNLLKAVITFCNVFLETRLILITTKSWLNQKLWFILYRKQDFSKTYINQRIVLILTFPLAGWVHLLLFSSLLVHVFLLLLLLLLASFAPPLVFFFLLVCVVLVLVHFHLPGSSRACYFILSKSEL